MNVKDNVKEMSTAIIAGLEIDKKSGVVSEKEDANIYESTLPEELTMAVVKQVNDHNTVYVAGAADAFGTLSLEAMVSNKGLDRTTGSIKMGVNDNIAMTMDRKREYPNPSGGDAVTKQGVVNVNLTVRAGKNAGQLKAVRTNMNELALAAFK